MNKPHLLLAAASLSCAALFAPAQAPTALRAGMVPGADLFVHVNMSQMNASAFSKAVEADQPAEMKQLSKEKEAQLLKATGMTDDDFLALVASADIDGLDLEAEDAEQLEDIPFVLALQLAKSITLDQAIELVKVFTEDMAPGELSFKKADVAGQPGVIIAPADPEAAGEGPDKAYLLLDKAGKTAIVGLRPEDVAAGKLRVDQEQKPSPSKELGKAIASLGQQQARVVVLLPEEIQALIKEQVNAPADPAAGMNPAAMMKPLANLSGIYVGITTAENMDFKLSMDVGDDASAMALNGMAQGMLPMAAMFGLPPTLSQKIKIVAEGSVVSIKATISPEDIKTMTQGVMTLEPPQ